MSQMDFSPETQVLVENFRALKNRDNALPAAVYESFLKIAEWGINAAAPWLSSDQKQELQNQAIGHLWESVDSLKDGEHTAKRLWLIARHRAKDYIKRYDYRKSSSLEGIEQEAKAQGREVTITQLVSTETPLDELIRSERHVLVNVALDQVGPECKSILLLRHVEGRSRKQIANTLSMGIHKLDKRLPACKALWKKIFERISEILPGTELEDPL